jgi:hypothetical protein
VNDDQSPLVNLMTCIDCNRAMRLEKIDPDGEGANLIQYRCQLCKRVERLRLLRQSRERSG